MIPTEMKEMHEEAEREKEVRNMRDARQMDPINENFELLKLAYDYLLNNEKLEEFSNLAKDASGLGLATVVEKLTKINANSNELIKILLKQLELSARNESTTDVLGDNGRLLARKTELKDGTLLKYEEFDELGNVVRTTNYDDNGNITNIEEVSNKKSMTM